MSGPTFEPGPDEEQSPGAAPGPNADEAADAGPGPAERWGGPGWAWVEGSADTGPVPLCDRAGPQPWPAGADGLPPGLDYAALVEGLAASGALGSDADDQDAEFAEWQAAEAEGRLLPADPAQVAAQAVEHMPPGAATAGWLEVAAAGMGRLDEYCLVGVTLAAHQQQARAAATKLSAIAALCAQTAAADPRIGLRAGGRPARVTRDALGQIELALKLTHYQAEELADLAVALTWRLPATGQALARGGIDLDRATLILGTLPPIPPAKNAPPGQPPRDDDDPGPSPADQGPSSAADGLADENPGTSGADGGPGQDRCAGPWDDLPAPRDQDAPPDDGLDDDPGPQDGPWDRAEDDDDLYGTGPVPAWPGLGAISPAPARRAGPADGRPVPGLLDATVPWTTLAGLASRPGTLSRIGPITAVQARLLARAAQADPAAQWRVIVTNTAGQAIAVARIRRARTDRARAGHRGPCPARDGLARDGPPPGTGLVGRVTVTITQDTLAAAQQQAGGPRGGPRPPGPGTPAGPGPPGGPGPPLSPVAAAVLRAAARAMGRALVRAAADQAAGGCAHTDQSPAYRPPPRLREYVIARDVTCRNPVCRQPAWRADLDHTRPYDQRGKTCRCNLGGGCRRDHQLKQHPRWKLQQDRPGVFQWTTPAGRTYVVYADTHPV